MDHYRQNQRLGVRLASFLVILVFCKLFAGADKSLGGLAAHVGIGSLYGGGGVGI